MEAFDRKPPSLALLGNGKRVGVRSILLGEHIIFAIVCALVVKCATADTDLVAHTATGFFKRHIDTQTSKFMLQVDDGVLVILIGLNNKTLDRATDDTKRVLLLLHDTKTALTHETLTLPAVHIDLGLIGID